MQRGTTSTLTWSTSKYTPPETAGLLLQVPYVLPDRDILPEGLKTSVTERTKHGHCTDITLLVYWLHQQARTGSYHSPPPLRVSIDSLRECTLSEVCVCQHLEFLLVSVLYDILDPGHQDNVLQPGASIDPGFPSLDS